MKKIFNADFLALENSMLLILIQAYSKSDEQSEWPTLECLLNSEIIDSSEKSWYLEAGLDDSGILELQIIKKS